MSFKIRSISELLRFPALETGHLGREEKEVRCLRKYTYISKKKAELNALMENCALKIITFRYFAFFVELPFFFYY